MKSRRRTESCVWMQLLTLFCAALFLFVSTAQAAHLHSPAKQGHHLQAPAAGSQTADAEEHCSLCVAMHPALPASVHVAPMPLLRDEPLAGLPPDDGVLAAWAFARFSRPPPPRA